MLHALYTFFILILILKGTYNYPHSSGEETNAERGVKAIKLAVEWWEGKHPLSASKASAVSTLTHGHLFHLCVLKVT